MTAALHIARLSKTYRAGLPGCSARVHALRSVDVSVATGELLGLLGPNGAGKSTLLLCAAGLMRPDAGTVRWFGSQPGQLPPPGIAYVPERATYYGFLTVRETLEYYATLHDLAARNRELQLDNIMERTGLAAAADRRVSQLSRGMTQRLGIAQALIGRPRLLLLDESLSGLDPVARRDAHELLAALRADGVTIVLSSHDLSSLEQIAGRVVVMIGGCVAASIDPARLRRSRVLEISVPTPALASRLLATRRPGIEENGSTLRIPLNDASAEEVLADCRAIGISVLSSRILADDLEQRFLDLVERPARVAEAAP